MASLPIGPAAAQLGVAEKTIRRRIKSGALTATMSNGKYLVEVPDGSAPTLVKEYREPPRSVRSRLGEIAFADPLGLYGGRAGFKSYNPSALVTRKGLQIYDEMLRDDQIKAALAFKTSAVTATGWKVESPPEKGEDWEQRRFIEDQLKAVPGTFEDAVGGILTALRYGYSTTEIVYEPITNGEWKGKVGLAALKARSPHSITFDVDEYGNIMPDGVIQMHRHDVGERRLPRDKFILYVYESEFGNPYGRSDLEACYRSFWTKDNAYKYLGMMLERYGIPPLFAMYNPEMYDSGQINALKEIFGSLQAATSGLIPRSAPENLEIWAPQLAGQVGGVFIPALEMLNRDIARALLMPGLLGVTPDQLGSFARAKVIFDVFLLVVEKLRMDLEEVINEQLVEPLATLNFSGDELPRFVWLPLSEDDQGQLLKTWGELLGAGAVTAQMDDEAHIRELLEFPERKEGEEPPATLVPPGMAPPPPTPEEVGKTVPVPPPGTAAAEDTEAVKSYDGPAERETAMKMTPAEQARLAGEFNLLFRGLAAMDAARDDLFLSRTAPVVERTVKGMTKRVVERFGEGREPDLETARAIEFVRRYGAERVQGISEETRKLLRQTLAEGLAAGDDREALARRIRLFFRSASEGRARTIAISEATRANNFGAMEGMSQAGVRWKRWLSMRDERVRETHVHLHGQVKALGEPFVTTDGDRGWFPGDDHFSAHNAIGCRCVLEPARLTSPRGARTRTFADEPDEDLARLREQHEAAMLAAVQSGLRAQKRAVLEVLLADDTPITFMSQEN